MKIKVISLKSRLDRRAVFEKDNGNLLPDFEFVDAFEGKSHTHKDLIALGFDTDKYWRDPILGRVLTKGEIGCFISHWRLWCECAAGGEDFLILEDDVVFEAPVAEIIRSAPECDLLYLAHKEMAPTGAVDLGSGFVKPCYPYHLSAYRITPACAAKLIEGSPERNIIPADEHVPRLLDRVNAVGFTNQMVYQKSRSDGGTDIEPTSELDYHKDFALHVLTCGSDLGRMEKYDQAMTNLGIKYQNVFHIGYDEWGGSDMIGPGGGQKINLILRYLEDSKVPDYDVVLFTDGYDAFFTRNAETIVGRFLGFKKDMVFSAEKHLWPDKSVVFPPSHTIYRYLNSGTFIARAGELRRFLQPVADSADDQLFMQRQFLSGKFDAVLDVEGYIFQTHEENLVLQSGMLYNPRTGCYSCIYHGNGGADAKQAFDRYYDWIHPKLEYANTKAFEVIGSEMLLVDFLTPEQCQEWIDISERHGGWNPHPDDKFPSHDIHLKELGLWEKAENHWNKVIAPICENYWQPYLHYHMRKAFTMKYSEDTQKTLGRHTDASLVTGSVKLNDSYEGAVLHFPRQGVTNKDIPIGKMILFPGQVTHGHFVDQLVSGTKYSATFWTARYKGDYLDPND